MLLSAAASAQRIEVDDCRSPPLRWSLPPASAQEVVPAAPGAGWRNVATTDDRRRLRNWRDAWMEALRDVATASTGGELARGGPLFEPDTALPNAAPPPGDYRCRTIKLGASPPGLLDYVAYPAFRCRIRLRGGRLHFTKLTGSQRPVGVFFPDNDRRMIFLGHAACSATRRGRCATGATASAT